MWLTQQNVVGVAAPDSELENHARPIFFLQSSRISVNICFHMRANQLKFDWMAEKIGRAVAVGQKMNLDSTLTTPVLVSHTQKKKGTNIYFP